MVETIGRSGFIHGGDGQRVKKTEGGSTLFYANRFYEKNLTNGQVTTHYYLGNQEVAYRTNGNLRYVYPDHLGGTYATTDGSGNWIGLGKYYPWGTGRYVVLDTDKKFTGQRLDSTGLYYCNARYYDPAIGRFISPDTIVPNPTNPQFLNRYAYCLNNPLKYTDSTGHFLDWLIDAASIIFDIGQLIAEPSWENGGYLAADMILGIVPFVPAGVGPGVKAVKGVNKIVEGANKIPKNTLELLRNAKIGKSGHLIVEKKLLNEIGQAESKGIDFSTLKKVVEKRGTPGKDGATSQIVKYYDDKGMKYTVHEVIDTKGNVIHRDFDSVRIGSGQIVDASK